MHTYTKFAPNVYVAKGETRHEKGETITLATRRGDEHECTVHNYLGQHRDGSHLHSITRNDGFDSRAHAQRKADRIRGYQSSAESRSNAAWEASKEGADFLRLAEPIKIGHHSEKRHRALIARNGARMDKAVEEQRKAEGYESKAAYWESRTDITDLSMPESLEYFEHKLEEAKKTHAGIKDGSIPKLHSYSLPYARKAVKELEKKVDLARKLWG